MRRLLDARSCVYHGFGVLLARSHHVNSAGETRIERMDHPEEFDGLGRVVYGSSNERLFDGAPPIEIVAAMTPLPNSNTLETTSTVMIIRFISLLLKG